MLPTLFAEESILSLRGTREILIGGHSWNIRYDEKRRMLYGLDKLFKTFSLNLYDSIHFTLGVNGVLRGRIYKPDGMEIKYKKKERSSTNTTLDDFFLCEEWSEDSDSLMSMYNLILT